MSLINFDQQLLTDKFDVRRVNANFTLLANALTADAQTLTSEQKTQARTNMGAASVAQGVPTGGVIGQALMKSGTADFATGWADVALPKASASISAASGFTSELAVVRYGNLRLVSGTITATAKPSAGYVMVATLPSAGDYPPTTQRGVAFDDNANARLIRFDTDGSVAVFNNYSMPSGGALYFSTLVWAE